MTLKTLGRELWQPVDLILVQGTVTQVEVKEICGNDHTSWWVLEKQTWNSLQSPDPQFLHLKRGTNNMPPLGTEQAVWIQERWLTPCPVAIVRNT